MIKIGGKLILSILLIPLQLITVDAQNPDNHSINETNDKEAIKRVIELFLVSAGNYDVETMSQLFLPDANIGWPSNRDGKWTTKSMTAETWFENLKKRTNPTRYTEPVSNYTIHISAGHLAFVLADATYCIHGTPMAHNMDYFVLMKDDEDWKILSGSFTSTPIEKK